jgi:hypothetical protein
MADEIKPALTQQEWADIADDPAWWADRVGEIAAGAGEVLEWRTNHPRPHAVAALALHGQPFGFTWEDVDLLRDDLTGEHDWAWEGDQRVDCGEFGDVKAARLALAAKIAALLPPRE